MQIRQLWPVNIGVDNLLPELTNQNHKALISTAKNYFSQNSYLPEQLMNTREMYCMLRSPCPGVQAYRKLLHQRMKAYLKAEGHPESHTVGIDTFMFARVMKKGERSKVHCHRGCDYVAVFYADLDVTDSGDPAVMRDAGGRFMVIDPVSYRSRAFNHTQNHIISPHPGMLIIHPSHVFHESEAYQGERDRVLVVANMRLREQIQMPNFELL